MPLEKLESNNLKETAAMSGLKNSIIFAVGQENTGFAQYFTGTSYLNMLSTQGVAIGNVTFEPACRNNWHIHRASKGGARSCWSPAAVGSIRSGVSLPGSFMLATL